MSWQKHSIAFKENIRVTDRFNVRLRPAGGGGGDGRSGGSGGGAPPIKIESNVILTARSKSGRVVARRDSHNIFLDYGRDWISHLIGLDAAGAYFREDRIKYMAFGIGGTSQRIAAADIRNPAIYNYPGYPNDWVGGVGSGDPSQTDVDPSVTALEWPVEVTNPGTAIYFDLISQPNTFPGTVGVIRFTSVLGLNEISFGAHPTVPLSEIGLFTAGDPTALDTTQPPVIAGGLPAEKFMVAYNTFDTLSKTTLFYLEVDWELRFS